MVVEVEALTFVEVEAVVEVVMMVEEVGKLTSACNAFWTFGSSPWALAAEAAVSIGLPMPHIPAQVVEVVIWVSLLY